MLLCIIIRSGGTPLASISRQQSVVIGVTDVHNINHEISPVHHCIDLSYRKKWKWAIKFFVHNSRWEMKVGKHFCKKVRNQLAASLRFSWRISGAWTCTCVTHAIVCNITREKEIGFVVLISRIQQTAPSTSRSFLSNSILFLHPVPIPLLTLPFPLSFVDTSPCLSSCSILFDSPSRI